EQVIDVGPEPYGISGTSEAGRVIFTNRAFDGDTDASDPNSQNRPGGVGFMQREAGGRVWGTPRYLNLTLGSAADKFDVNNAQAVVVTQDLRWAFVTGYNQYIQGVASHDPDISLAQPAGGNVGIIRDPFRLYTQDGDPKQGLIAATRMTPYSFPDNLALSPNGEFLYVAYSGSNQVQVFGVSAMIAEVERILALPANQGGGLDALARTPINEFLRPYSETGALLGPDDDPNLVKIPNPLIDVQADYRLRGTGLRQEFGNFINQDRAPLAPGASPRGIAVQDDFLKLLTPASTADVTDTTPTFTWTTSGRAGSARLFVSAFQPGQGLFPSDKPASATYPNPDHLATAYGQYILTGSSYSLDANANRIYTSDRFDLENGAGVQSTTLPDLSMLTQGQSYWWGVEVTTPDGRVYRDSQQFKVAAAGATPASNAVPTTFAAVTLITHGFQVPYLSDGRATTDISNLIELGQAIARQGDGALFVYHPADGTWSSPDGVSMASVLGKSLVLVSDWTREAAISDSGFAEAAADALFASIMGMVATGDAVGTALKTSAWHMIGFGRGASVTSEIVQRFGAYLPTGTAGGIPDLQVTTLDPHDFTQDSLAFPLKDALSIVSAASNLVPYVGKYLSKFVDALAKAVHLLALDTLAYNDFKDPTVENWSNISFLDNYYQDVGGDTPPNSSFTSFLIDDVFKRISFSSLLQGFTSNGRAITGADVNLNLNGRPGFQYDDPYIGLGSPDARTVAWYAGTADLQLQLFPGNADLATTPNDRIWRQVADRLYVPSATNERILRTGFLGNGFPWYRAQEVQNGAYLVPKTETFARTDTRSWEGIGAGAFYSVLGGGVALRPQNAAAPTDLATNNTQFGVTDAPIPSVFDGDFQASIRPFFGRFPLIAGSNTWLEVPGWSLQGGSGGKLQGLALAPHLQAGWFETVQNDLIAAATDLVNSGLHKSEEVQALITKLVGAAGQQVQGQGYPLYDFFGALLGKQISKQVDTVKSAVWNDPVAAFTEVRNTINAAWLAVKADVLAEVSGELIGDFFATLKKKASLKGIASAASGAIKGAIDDAIPALESYLQEKLLDYSFQLSIVNDTLTHNRMYIGPDASRLALDFAVNTGVDAGSVLQVYATDDAGQQTWQIGSVSMLGQAGVDLKSLTKPTMQTVRLNLPPDLRGHAVTLSFKWVAANPLDTIQLDNIRMDAGIVITDNYGDHNDQAIYLSNALHPLGPQGPEVAGHFESVDGTNRIAFTVSNTNSTARVMRITVGANYFVELEDGLSSMVVNDGADHTLAAFTLAAGASKTLYLRARVSDAALPKFDNNEAWLMQAPVTIDTLSGSRVVSRTTLMAYHLAELSDLNAYDGTLNLPDTRVGGTRTVHIKNDTPLAIYGVDGIPWKTKGGVSTLTFTAQESDIATKWL
ncbi:MAG: hypothetical protein K2Q07_02370, partial [Burkholderiaceae bacterium]|nr:hypothetical protein [Burkholderiaceae bacterium]